jgi:hypothetical protein
MTTTRHVARVVAGTAATAPHRTGRAERRAARAPLADVAVRTPVTLAVRASTPITPTARTTAVASPATDPSS